MATETNLPSQYDTDYGYDKTYDPAFITEQQIALDEASARVLARSYQRADAYGYAQPNSNGAGQQYPFTITDVDVVMHQPGVSTKVIRTRTRTCYTVLSVFTCLCCCMPLGLVALIMSLKAKSAADEGSYEVARSYDESSKYLNIAGIMIGLIIVVIAGVLYHSFSTDPYHY
ncbi:hypothetical protein SNE40_015935 [Patella caerulea]|uniref:Uncharacterized protein n=1 Tax=Patella caerulea TaxID=87958 RepID=A0AAN8J8Z2_PATCE